MNRIVDREYVSGEGWRSGETGIKYNSNDGKRLKERNEDAIIMLYL